MSTTALTRCDFALVETPMIGEQINKLVALNGVNEDESRPANHFMTKVSRSLFKDQ